MKDTKNLAGELLRQNGLNPGVLSDEDRERLRDIFSRDEARVNRVKWVAIVCWVLFLGIPITGMLVSTVFDASEGGQLARTLTDVVAIVEMCVFWVAIVCTVSWFIRARSLGQRRILAKLTDIERQIARMGSEGGQPDRLSDEESTGQAANGA